MEIIAQCLQLKKHDEWPDWHGNHLLGSYVVSKGTTDFREWLKQPFHNRVVRRAGNKKNEFG